MNWGSVISILYVDQPFYDLPNVSVILYWWLWTDLAWMCRKKGKNQSVDCATNTGYAIIILTTICFHFYHNSEVADIKQTPKIAIFGNHPLKCK